MESYVKAVRTMLGMTQADVAVVLSRSTRTIKRWESGEVHTPIPMLRKLRSYYLSMFEYGRVSPLTKDYLDGLFEEAVVDAFRRRRRGKIDEEC